MQTSGTVSRKTVDALTDQLRGEVIRPGDAGYDEARAVHNGTIDRRPGAIARCADVADVITAIRLAREDDALVSVRGGGHNGAGLGVCDGGLVIDLSSMRGIRVDPAAQTVRADGGCTLGDVDHATHAFGLATPSGIISTTGISGSDARRRHRPPQPPLRAVGRQPPQRGCRAGRRFLRHRHRSGPPGPVLGPPRRRRQLRGGHLTRAPLPSGAQRRDRPDPVRRRGRR